MQGEEAIQSFDFRLRVLGCKVQGFGFEGHRIGFRVLGVKV